MIEELKTPQERLKHFIKEIYKTQADFAKLMGIDAQYLQKYTKIGGSVFQSFEKYQQLAELGLNVEWYKTGTGEMLLDNFIKETDETDLPDTLNGEISEEYKRLEYYAEKYYGNILNMGRQCGVSASALYMYKTKRRFGMKMYDTLQRKCGINPDFLKFGTPPEIISEQPGQVRDSSAVYNIGLDKYADIDFYDVPAHACVGSFVDFQDLPVSSRKVLMTFHKSDPKNLRGIRVAGRSMEEARIFDGDMAVYDVSKTPKNHDTIVIILNGVIMIKKYMLNNGIIELHSAFNGTDPIIVNETDDQLEIIGVVRGVVSYR